MSQSIATRLASEVERQLDIQSKLGEALLRELHVTLEKGNPVLDASGEVVDTRHVPDREWARCYGHYRGANQALLAEQREGIKLRHMLNQRDTGLTPEQEAEELLLLGKETLATLTRDELAAELTKRGLRVEPVTDSE
jgi:hypothetical protein